MFKFSLLILVYLSLPASAEVIDLFCVGKDITNGGGWSERVRVDSARKKVLFLGEEYIEKIEKIYGNASSQFSQVNVNQDRISLYFDSYHNGINESSTLFIVTRVDGFFSYVMFDSPKNKWKKIWEVNGSCSKFNGYKF